MYRICLLVSILFLFYGCSVHVSSNYPPSILLNGKGDVNITKFTMLPEDCEIDDEGNIYKNVQYIDNTGNTITEKRILSPYQIDTKYGLNPIYMDKPLSDFITDAVKKEFKFIGYTNSVDATLIVTGEIKEISVDYIGFTNVTFIADIEFIIRKDNKEIYRKISKGKYITSKWTTMDFTSGIYTSVARSIEDFIKQAQGQGIL